MSQREVSPMELVDVTTRDASFEESSIQAVPENSLAEPEQTVDNRISFVLTDGTKVFAETMDQAIEGCPILKTLPKKIAEKMITAAMQSSAKDEKTNEPKPVAATVKEKPTPQKSAEKIAKDDVKKNVVNDVVLVKKHPVNDISPGVHKAKFDAAASAEVNSIETNDVRPVRFRAITEKLGKQVTNVVVLDVSVRMRTLPRVDTMEPGPTQKDLESPQKLTIVPKNDMTKQENAQIPEVSAEVFQELSPMKNEYGSVKVSVPDSMLIRADHEPVRENTIVDRDVALVAPANIVTSQQIFEAAEVYNEISEANTLADSMWEISTFVTGKDAFSKSSAEIIMTSGYDDVLDSPLNAEVVMADVTETATWQEPVAEDVLERSVAVVPLAEAVDTALESITEEDVTSIFELLRVEIQPSLETVETAKAGEALSGAIIEQEVLLDTVEAELNLATVVGEASEHIEASIDLEETGGPPENDNVFEDFLSAQLELVRPANLTEVVSMAENEQPLEDVLVALALLFEERTEDVEGAENSEQFAENIAVPTELIEDEMEDDAEVFVAIDAAPELNDLLVNTQTEVAGQPADGIVEAIESLELTDITSEQVVTQLVQNIYRSLYPAAHGAEGSFEKPVITRDTAAQLAALLRVIGYEHPEQVLRGFMERRDWAFLLQAIRSLYQLTNAGEQQEAMANGLSRLKRLARELDHRLVARIGTTLLGRLQNAFELPTAAQSL